MDENTQDTSTPAPENKSSNTMMFVIGAIVLAGILGYVIFSSANNDVEEPVTEEATVESTDEAVTEEIPDDTVDEIPEQDMTTDPTSTDQEVTEEGVKVFEIEAGAYYYNPNLITVNVGDTVRIVMTSADMMHDFNIDELGVDMPVTQSGSTGTVEFTVTEAGSYEFYCSVGQHRQNGQVGTLVVQ